MRKSIIAVVTLCVGVLSMFFSISAPTGSVYAESKQEILNLVPSYSKIESVDWVASVKSGSSNSSMSSTPNVCALWVSPVGDYTTIEIEVDRAEAESNGWKWPVMFVGMCTWNNPGANNTADRIRVTPAVITGAGEVNRGSWNNPTGGPAWLDVKKFMEVADVTELGGGKKLYETKPIVRRCHKGVPESAPNACSDQGILIKMIIDESTDYFAESNVSSGETTSYATTGITDVYKVANATTINVKKGDTVSVRFSHNVFSKPKGDGVDWRVTTEGNGWSLIGSGGGSGRAVFSESDTDRGYYIGGPRLASSGDRTFIFRDDRVVTFNETGTFDFCELMSVKGVRLTKVCAKVVVGEMPNPGTCDEWRPQYYTIGTTNVVSKVKIINRELSAASGHSGWQDDEIFARPDDNVLWRNCYFPGAQEYAKTGIATLPGWYEAPDIEGVCYDSYIYKRRFMDILGDQWTNKFEVETLGLPSPFGLNNGTGVKVSNTKVSPKYDPGDTSTQSVENNLIVNRTTDVNKTYKDEIRTVGGPTWASVVSRSHSWSAYCCISNCGCACRDEDDCCPTYAWVTHVHINNPWTTGNFNNNVKTDQSKVTVPYNYINSAGLTVETKNTYDVVYAGETIFVNDSVITVGTKKNQIVDSEYTTKVDNAQAKLYAYVSVTNVGDEKRVGDGNICSYLPQVKQCELAKDYDSSQFNPSGDTNGWKRRWYFDGQYNVFDASAGDYMCFVIALYPSTSGDDTNTDPSGDGEWYISKPACKKIAKRPSIQIWGGDLYSGGGISTSVSVKQQLWGVDGYSYLPTSRSSVVVNGSWVEEGIVAKGKVTELSSGASLGGVSGNARNSGGLNTTSLCATRAPLSFANFSANVFKELLCPVEAVGWSEISSTIKNREALADYWGVDGDGNTSIYLSSDGGNVSSATGKDIKVYNNSGDVTINGGSIGANTTRVVRTSKNVVINGNIVYEAGTMSSAGEVPKAIVYGKNIKISCGVNRVDAILIAEELVTTCGDYTGHSNLDAQERANQLIINGIVISNKLDAGRTYGNSTGNGSGVAAEVINYDTSTLIWGRYMAGASESDTMTVTYQHELAPRY